MDPGNLVTMAAAMRHTEPGGMCAHTYANGPTTIESADERTFSNDLWLITVESILEVISLPSAQFYIKVKALQTRGNRIILP